MTCSVAKGLMSSYLDGAVTRSQMAQMDEHLRACVECAARFASLQRTQSLVGSLGRKPAPPDLALKLRVALSQELANSRRSRWERLRVRWENAFNAIMVPATAGAAYHSDCLRRADQRSSGRRRCAPPMTCPPCSTLRPS